MLLFYRTREYSGAVIGKYEVVEPKQELLTQPKDGSEANSTLMSYAPKQSIRLFTNSIHCLGESTEQKEIRRETKHRTTKENTTQYPIQPSLVIIMITTYDDEMVVNSSTTKVFEMLLHNCTIIFYYLHVCTYSFL